MSKRAGGVVTNAVWYGVIVVLGVAAVIALGWARPDVSAFVSDVTTWGSELLDMAIRAGREVLAS